MDEKKTYSIVGKVEIGTDEYRDLIEGISIAKCETDDYRRRYYDYINKAQCFEKENDNLKGKIADFVAFIKTDENISLAYKNYKLHNQEVD